MKIFNFETVELEDAGPGAEGVKVRWVINEKTGAPNFAMRIFDFVPGGRPAEQVLKMPVEIINLPVGANVESFEPHEVQAHQRVSFSM